MKHINISSRYGDNAEVSLEDIPGSTPGRGLSSILQNDRD